MKTKKYVVIIAERGTNRKMCEATALFELYSHLYDKVRDFNNFNCIVESGTGFTGYKNISREIEVEREMFDKLYEGALLLKLPIDMTFNYDEELWYMTVKYKNTELCFTNNDN